MNMDPMFVTGYKHYYFYNNFLIIISVIISRANKIIITWYYYEYGTIYLAINAATSQYKDQPIYDVRYNFYCYNKLIIMSLL